ncbi:MAG: hypothetical protein E4H03_10675 [Myxococcales bacterium]|jgi:hypothetical protein|nr:MAG: hypothetical protein E4H03_10675 [Myxococcales bacterium]
MKIWDTTSDAAGNAKAHDIDGPIAILRASDGKVVVAPYYRASVENAGHAEIAAALVPLAPVERSRGGGPRRAILVTAPGAVVHLNGYPPASVATLSDRDEIRLGAVRLVLAAFDTTEIEPFDTVRHGPADCAACSTPIVDGDPVLACPACGVRYHAGRDGDSEPVAPACDVEDARCSNCRRLRAELVWTPADLAGRDADLDDDDDFDNAADVAAEAHDA